MHVPDTETVPATAKVAAKSWGFIANLLLGRSDVISMWPEAAYDVGTKTWRFANQHYMLCNHPDAVRHVMLDQHQNYDVKSPMQRQWLEPLIGDGLFVSDGQLWNDRRKACAPALTNDLMPLHATIMCEAARDLASRWEGLTKAGPIDVLNEMALLTSRIIARSLFGDDVTDDEASQIVDGFSEYQRIAETVDLGLMMGLPAPEWLGGRRRKATREAAKKVHDVIDRLIARTAASSRMGSRTLPSILRGDAGSGARAGGCPITESAIRNEAIVMFMAGHETTANSLAWTWYLLDCSPVAAGRMHAELDAVLGARSPTLEDVPQLIYTRAVFEEALRLYPPVAAMGRQAREKDIVCERRVGRGTIMLIIPWLLHRHKRHWIAPNAFRPERFLPDAPRPSKFLYIPFSAGHRICLGLRFGLTEAILCLATLAQRFRPRLMSGRVVEPSCHLTLRPKDGLPMLIEPRA